jgi:hypothetical protein
LANAPSEGHAAAHIGLYFRWCLSVGLVSDEHTQDDEFVPLLDRIGTGELMATDYLWENFSGKLADVDFNEEGNRFSKWYFSKRYLSDLRAVSGLGDYEFTEADVDFKEIKALLDQRLQEWRKAPPSQPWWKFWA